MNIADIKQVGKVDTWIDFDGEITEIKETKQRTKKNRLMQKVRLMDSTGDIGAWLYADIQQCAPRQIISANGMIKEYKDVRYLDYATVKDDQQTPQGSPQASQNAPQSTKAPQTGKDTPLNEITVKRDLVCSFVESNRDLNIEDIEGWKNYILKGYGAAPPDNQDERW